jgi:hypothetical protein
VLSGFLHFGAVSCAREFVRAFSEVKREMFPPAKIGDGGQLSSFGHHVML